MNQTSSYDTAFTIPALRRHLLNNSGEGGKEEALTEKEQKLFKILSQTKGERLIAISIRTRISGGSIRGFREMIKELYEQSEVAKEELIEAIGEDAVELIENILR